MDTVDKWVASVITAVIAVILFGAVTAIADCNYGPCREEFIGSARHGMSECRRGAHAVIEVVSGEPVVHCTCPVSR